MERTMLDARTMRRLRSFVGLSLSIAGALIACGAPRLPAPVHVGQPTEALQLVAYPPPPARVEYVPPAPNEQAVWIDGEWTWQGRRWAWKRGRWILPPASARFSPWTAARGKTGLLYVAEGKWRDAQGRELPDPAPLVVGRTRGGPVTNPEGEAIPATPNVHPGTPSGTPKGNGDSGVGPPETPSGATPTGTEPKTVPSAGSPPEQSVVDAGID